MTDVADPRFTLHIANRDDVARLGRNMGNCLAGYGRGRTTGAHRIVEVLEDGRTKYAVHVHAGRIAMFEAANNCPPHRRDIPIVRRLLEQAGVLDATRAAAEAMQREPVGQPAQRRQPVRRRARTQPRPTARRPRRPPPLPGISVQELAAELLRPPRFGAPEWPELAAALWASGILPVLPDPERSTFEQVTRDLAERIATGQDDGLPRRAPRSEPERRDAAETLRRERHPTTWSGWQRHRMAEVLLTELRP